jgi:hypothetical protein
MQNTKPGIGAAIGKGDRGVIARGGARLEQLGRVGVNMDDTSATARRRVSPVRWKRSVPTTSSPAADYPVLQHWEQYRETFPYVETFGLPKTVTDQILRRNAQQLFGFAH